MARVPNTRGGTVVPALAGGHMDRTHSLIMQEEEIKIAEVESSLRQTCLDLCKPTILRMSLVHGEMQETKKQMQELADFVKQIDSSVQLVLARSEYIQVLKTQLEDTTARLRETDSRLTANGKVFRERISLLESANEAQHNWNDKIDRGFERVSQDLEDLRTSQKKFKEVVDAGFSSTRDLLGAEVASVKLAIAELEARMTTLNDDIWGPDKVEDVSPPSLRRLDMQMRKVQSRLVDALSDLTALRRLEGDMKDMSKEQGSIRVSQQDLEVDQKILRERVEKIGRDVKHDSQEAANRMAAFTASLMRDVRGTFGEEVKSLQEMQNEMRSFVLQTKSNVDDLDRAIQSVRKHVEAVLREMRIDIDGVDTKRKRDKQGLQEGVAGLQDQWRSSLEAVESTLKGLEHISKVLSMALQGERVSIALEVQDFVDRKDMPYVGVRAPPERLKTGQGKASPRKEMEKVRRREGLDPSLLMRLQYQPTPVSFQGSEFDRAQLLALRERLVHTAQQVLQRGPTARPPKGTAALLQEDIPGPLVPGALGAFGDVPLPSGRRSVPPGSRPGSRAQPSARGSPLQQEEAWSMVGKDTPQASKDSRTCPTPDGSAPPAFGAFVGQGATPRRHSNDSPEGGGTHLPALAPVGVDVEKPQSSRAPDSVRSRPAATAR